MWYTFKGGVGAQASPESSSDAGFNESGKDMHSFTRCIVIREESKVLNFVFVMQISVLVWDTPGLYAYMN